MKARSPREKIRANRPLATTLRASGRSSAPSLIEAANDAVRLKHSNAEAGPKGREPDLKCHFGAIHIPIGSVSQVTAQDSENTVTLIDNSSDFEEPSPIFIRIWCQKSSCPGMELKVTTLEENYTVSDPNRIELSFEASGQVDFQVTANSGTSLDDLRFEMSEWVNADSSSIIIEDEDWLDNVPSPGITVNQEIVDPIWDCPIDNCQKIEPSGTH